jgi:hypothetical protein
MGLKLRQRFSKFLGIMRGINPSPHLSFGILKPCTHCTFGKSREKIYLVAGEGYSREGQVIMMIDNATGKVYRREGLCLGVKACRRCLIGVEVLPCKWREL